MNFADAEASFCLTCHATADSMSSSAPASGPKKWSDSKKTVGAMRCLMRIDLLLASAETDVP